MRADHEHKTDQSAASEAATATITPRRSRSRRHSSFRDAAVQHGRVRAEAMPKRAMVSFSRGAMGVHSPSSG